MMQSLEAPVTRVTVLEDRGFVTRTGKMLIPAGLSRWQIKGVSPVLVDKTLTARLEGCSGECRVVNLRVERFRPETPPPPLPEEPLGRQERDARLRRLEAQLALVGRELESARTLYAQLLREMTLEVAWGKAERPQWDSQLAELQSWKMELLDRQVDLEGQIEAEKRPGGVFKPAARPAPLQRGLLADVAVEIESSQQQTGEVEVVIEYAVPGACWRPYHTATLEGDRVEFRSEGCVWQNTGEDWNDVELFFSTQRPSLGSAPPGLPCDVLSARKKSQETVVRERDLEINELEADAPKSEVRSAEVPGIDDAGDAVNLRGLTRARIPSNGQPLRIELFSFRTSALVERVLLAEMCPDVVVKSTHKNESTFPILAGPVDLIREAGLIGRGSTLYVAAGENFTLGWGPDPLLRAQRRKDKKEEKKDDLLGGWFRVDHSVTVTVSNLSLETCPIRVTERVPVSELKQVEVVVDSKETSEGLAPDANGFVTWQVDIGPRGRKELRLGYAVRRRKEVVGI